MMQFLNGVKAKIIDAFQNYFLSLSNKTIVTIMINLIILDFNSLLLQLSCCFFSFIAFYFSHSVFEYIFFQFIFLTFQMWPTLFKLKFLLKTIRASYSCCREYQPNKLRLGLVVEIACSETPSGPGKAVTLSRNVTFFYL